MFVIGRMFCCIMVRLRDAIAALSCRLANTIVPWDQVHTLASNHLIALVNALEFIQCMCMGEILNWIVGRAVCMTTRVDVVDLCDVDQL